MTAARRLAASAARIVVASAVGLTLLAGGTFAGLRAYGRHRLEQAVDATERSVGPLRLDLPRAAPVADEHNAAKWIEQAVAELDLSETELLLLSDAVVVPVASWSHQHVSLVVELRQRSAPSLLSLAHAASLPSAAFNLDHAAGDYAEITSPIRLASGIRLLTALARLDLAQGDDVAAHTSLRSLARMAGALEGELDIVLQFTGWTAEAMLLTLLAEEVARPEATLLERGTDLAALIPASDLAASFNRFVAWNLASQSPLTVAADGRWQWKQWSRPGASWRHRAEHAAIGELRAALDLEALASYARAVRAGSDRDPRVVDPQVDDPSGANLDRFAGWMQGCLTSRRLLLLAVAARHQMWQQERPPAAVCDLLAPVDDPSLTMVVDNRRLLISVRDGDELAARVTASRFNPAPPLRVAVAVPAAAPAS